MSRILFLDIDGVINPIPQRTRLRTDVRLADRLAKQSGNNAYRRLPPSTLQLACHGWDQTAMKLLRMLCEEESLSIVISSSWGIFYSLKELKLLFALYEMDAYLVDITPYIGKRSENILSYVQTHPAIHAWISLDDLPMDHLFPNHAVTTHGCLQAQDVQKARELLKRQR